MTVWELMVGSCVYNYSIYCAKLEQLITYLSLPMQGSLNNINHSLSIFCFFYISSGFISVPTFLLTNPLR